MSEALLVSDAATPAAGPRPGAARFGRCLAVLLALPGLAYLIDSGGEAWPLVLGAFLAPLAIGRRDAARVWAVGVAWGMALPLVSTLAGWFVFQPERVLVHGALAALAWRGALWPAPTRSALVRWARFALLAWLAWSAGSALRGVLLNLPADVPASLSGGLPWVGRAFSGVLLRSVAPVSSAEPAFPLWALLLRFDTLLLVWASLEIGRRRPDAGRLLARELPLAITAGLAVSFAEYVQGSLYRGESVLARLGQGVPRSHRPFPDHNSLGAAMLLALPVLVRDAWSAWRERRVRGNQDTGSRWRLAVAFLGLGAALFLLYASRSKSAFGGLAVAAGVAALAAALHLPRRARRFVLGGCLLAVAGVVVLNLLPKPALDVLTSTRRSQDVVRVFHLTPLRAYLETNRYAVWSAGAAMARSAPVFGVGLGNFPRELESFRGPAEKYEFNPLHENAHDMFLQWWAEDGIVGLLLGLSVVLLSLAACFAALRVPPTGSADPARGSPVPWLAALCGFTAALLVGHPLLVAGVALYWAAWTGLALSYAPEPEPVTESGSEPGTRRVMARILPARTSAVVPALGLLALAPLAWRAHAPLETWAVGCYPWMERPYDTPDRARVLMDDARWIQRWGEGSRMILPLFDVRPWKEETVQHLDVWLGDELVEEGFALPRSQSVDEMNPVTYLKFDRPAGVKTGDPVAIRIQSDVRWSQTFMHNKGFEIVGPRHLPPVFRDPFVVR